MAKRRQRIEARVSKIKSKSARSTEDATVTVPAPTHVRRKLQKRGRFLESVKTSALAARAAVFKRKRKAHGGVSLDSLVRRSPHWALAGAWR